MSQTPQQRCKKLKIPKTIKHKRIFSAKKFTYYQRTQYQFDFPLQLKQWKLRWPLSVLSIYRCKEKFITNQLPPLTNYCNYTKVCLKQQITPQLKVGLVLNTTSDFTQKFFSKKNKSKVSLVQLSVHQTPLNLRHFQTHSYTFDAKQLQDPTKANDC